MATLNKLRNAEKLLQIQFRNLPLLKSPCNMNRYIAIIFSFLFSSCASYKVIPEGELKKLPGGENIFINKQNKWPEGAHCFEPLFYVLSLGIIPTHCVDTYTVTTESSELGTVKVTSMQGWVTLLMAPFPVWQYGFGTENDIVNDVNSLIEVAE